LGYGVTVALQILILSVLVRIQVTQQKQKSCTNVRDFLHSSGASLLAKAMMQKETDEQSESGLFFLPPPIKDH
jgi:hypothetical protein